MKFEMSSRFFSLCFIVVVVENPFLYKYVVENGISTFNASSAKLGSDCTNGLPNYNFYGCFLRDRNIWKIFLLIYISVIGMFFNYYYTNFINFVFRQYIFLGHIEKNWKHIKCVVFYSIYP